MRRRGVQVFNTESMKKTLILGASLNPARYSYLAAEILHEYGYPFTPVGLRVGVLFGEEILDIRNKPFVKDVHTVTLYLGPHNQVSYYDYVVSLKPARVIFNPGSENGDFEKLLEMNHIEAIQACTLVMLRSGQY